MDGEAPSGADAAAAAADDGAARLKEPETSEAPAAVDEESMEDDDTIVFAFFKPKPMITDLRKGGMGDVARRMCPGGPMPKPVGQLDRNTTGLMLFTCCGRLTEHLNNHVAKTYRVWYLGSSGTGITSRLELTDSEVQRLRDGVFLAREQIHARFDEVRRLGGEELPSFRKPSGEIIQKFRFCADVTIRCGAFHVVKRLFDAVGAAVSELQRIRVSGLALEDLKLPAAGDFCELSAKQRALLWGNCACRSGGGPPPSGTAAGACRSSRRGGGSGGGSKRPAGEMMAA
eukprot:TRINITY_DN27690_c0_g1_i1.p1 TRINITY_DN27690_c0_g1~~TRINITY_DN27690_c0_g1_i1.p1  ORF type:complete len:287 (-),score=81.01 TRINITY_DN27690_c0_g1_i1:141-1001(-)